MSVFQPQFPTQVDRRHTTHRDQRAAVLGNARLFPGVGNVDDVKADVVAVFDAMQGFVGSHAGTVQHEQHEPCAYGGDAAMYQGRRERGSTAPISDATAK